LGCAVMVLLLMSVWRDLKQIGYLGNEWAKKMVEMNKTVQELFLWRLWIYQTVCGVGHAKKKINNFRILQTHYFIKKNTNLWMLCLFIDCTSLRLQSIRNITDCMFWLRSQGKYCDKILLIYFAIEIWNYVENTTINQR